MNLPYETMKRTTELTQATFTPDAVLSPQATQGNLPTASGLRALFALDEKFKGHREILHNAALSYGPLRELVGQYIDLNTGEPLAGARAQNGGVALGDKFACFGRGCGEQPGCFASCSLGPSHMANGQPLGPSGKAPIRWPNGQVAGPEVEGVLKNTEGTVTNMPDGKPRHRDNSCLLLSFGNRIFSIPPAPAGDLCDKLYAMMPDVINHVTNTAVLPAMPAPQQQQAPQPSVAPPPPVMSAPAAPPMNVAPPPPTQQPVGLPAGGVAPPPPAPTATAPAPAPAGTEFPVLTAQIDENYRREIRACVMACTRSEIKPMSQEAAQNMLNRHVEKGSTQKAMRSAWIKAAFDRGLATAGGVDGKLKQEHWPKELPQIDGYWGEKSVAAAPTEAPAPAGPVLAPPVGQPPTYQLKPGAPASTPQKIDAVEESSPRAAASAIAAPVINMKEVASFLRTAGNALLNAAASLMSEPDAPEDDGEIVQPPAASQEAGATPVEESDVKATKGKKATKPPKAPKAAKAPKKKKATAPVGAKPHPRHPEVHAEPSAWQPGSRGRPPKGITRTKAGVLKFGKGWREINGKWHAPLKA